MRCVASSAIRRGGCASELVPVPPAKVGNPPQSGLGFTSQCIILLLQCWHRAWRGLGSSGKLTAAAAPRRAPKKCGLLRQAHCCPRSP